MINDQAVADSKTWLPDVTRGDQELLAKEGILGEELHLGARKIREETTTHATGLTRCGCERRLDQLPTRTADPTEDFTHVPPERRQHGCQ